MGEETLEESFGTEEGQRRRSSVASCEGERERESFSWGKKRMGGRTKGVVAGEPIFKEGC
jgi:hypothetical protein